MSLRFYQQLLARLEKMSIRGNQHKMAVYVNLDPNQLPGEKSLSESTDDNTVFAFHIMFERNNPDSEWRLVTPLRFTD